MVIHTALYTGVECHQRSALSFVTSIIQSSTIGMESHVVSAADFKIVTTGNK